MYTIDQIRLDMQTLKQNGKSWRYIGKHYNIQPSMARLILLGHEPGKKVSKYSFWHNTRQYPGAERRPLFMRPVVHHQPSQAFQML